VTPAPIVDRLNKELRAILASGEVKKQLLIRGSEADYLCPDEYGLLAMKQMNLWASVAKKGNIKVED
jgi:tripartite-type tricarboxylate transporter receptor subunit TctC